MGTRGKIVDVIHHLSPKVPIISLRYFTLDVEFLDVEFLDMMLGYLLTCL